jgi:bacillopeptidase F
MVAVSAVSANAQVEIAYDDGTPESGVVWDLAGNGVAVKFTAPPGCVLTAAKFSTCAAWFRNPLGIRVLDADGTDGAPGTTLRGYFEVPLESAQPQAVTFATPIALPHPEFYVEYVQTGYGTSDANVFCIDTSSPSSGRSWLFQDGVWSQMTPEQGNVMIRALVLQPTPAAGQTWGSIKGDYR